MRWASHSFLIGRVCALCVSLCVCMWTWRACLGPAGEDMFVLRPRLPRTFMTAVDSAVHFSTGMPCRATHSAYVDLSPASLMRRFIRSSSNPLPPSQR